MASRNDSNSAPGHAAGGSPFGQGRNKDGQPRSAHAHSAEKAEADILRRVPPHSVEAEQAVLGGVFMRPQLMSREYTRAPLFRKVLQSICWQVSSGEQIIVIGAVQPDGTVKGGTGWGAEFAKICNKPLLVFDQAKNAWFFWDKANWTQTDEPLITHPHFAATGTRFLEDNGRIAIQNLFARSFSR